MTSYRGNYKGTPYVVIVFAIATAILVNVLVATKEPPWVLQTTIAFGVGLILAISWLTVSSLLIDGDPEPVRGTLAILSLVALIAAPIAAMWQIDAHTEWVDFLVVIVIAGAAIIFFSTEWSRRWLLAMCALALLLISVHLARIGVVAERIETFDTRITETIDERKELETKATAALIEAESKLNTTAEEAKSQLVQLLGPKDSPAEMAARNLVLLLTTRPLDESAQADAELRLDQFLDYLTSADLSLYQTTQLRDSAVSAVAAYTKTAAGASTEALDLAIKKVCAAAQAAGADTCPEPFQGGSAGDSERDLGELEVALASYRFAVTGSDADKATRDALIAAEPNSLEIPDWRVGTGAADALLDQLAGENPIHIVPGPVGWALVAFGLVLGLRVLLRRNAAQYAGPVQIDYAGADMKEELSIAILTNLPTPAAAPGALLAQSITDLTSIAEPNTKTLATIVKAITDTLAPPQGYIISADVAKPSTPATSPPATTSTTADPPASDGADGDTSSTMATNPTNNRVLLRVTSAADKESIAAKVFIDPEPAAAVQSAGLWAAGLLLSRSTRVPTWASWNEATAQALKTVSLSKEPTLQDLEQALRTAPSSGIVLQHYGNELELHERELDAVDVYARAVAAHPRYLVARYRLGAAVGMLANNPEPWCTATSSRRDAILANLHQAATATGTPHGHIDSLAGQTPSSTQGRPTRLPDDLREVATDFLEHLQRDLSWRRRPSGWLRRSDRDAVWNLDRQSNDPPRNRQWRLKYLAKFAARVYAPTPKPLDAQDERTMRNPKAGWQLTYNAACLQVKLKNYSDALDLLDECLTRPHVEQLRADWVRKDSDLACLKNQPRFQRFIEQLEGTKES